MGFITIKKTCLIKVFYLITLLLLLSFLTFNQGRTLSGALFNAFYSASFLLLFVIVKQQFSQVIFIVFSIVYGLNLFYSMSYGTMDIGVMSSIMETDTKEAIEFFISASKFIFVFSFLFSIGLYVCLMALYREFTYSVSWNKAMFSLPFIIIFTGLVVKGGANIKLNKRVENVLSRNLFTNPFLVFNRYFHYKSIELEQLSAMKTEWQGVKRNSNSSDVYLVLIGESAIRERFAFYGYNRNTTDKLEDIENITLVQQAISPSVITRDSLPRILAINEQKKVNYNLNIVDLANDAGFRTYWLSNQVAVGKHETPITLIAKRADSYISLNESYISSKNDFVFLESLEALLSNDVAEPKVIFLHSMGSHPNFCSRIEGTEFRLSPLQNEVDIECYDNSIFNTYQLLLSIRALFEKHQLDYQLSYFSDHGLVRIPQKPYLAHGAGKLFKEAAVDVPMLFMSSHHLGAKRIPVRYYLRDFPHTFAHWVGIEAQQIDLSKSVLHEDFMPSKQENYTLDASLSIKYLEN